MKTRTSRLFRLNALAVGLCLAQTVLAADPGAAPSYQALPAGNLCPTAAGDSRYNIKYLGFFTYLVQAQDDWLFRTAYDLRTDFGTSAEGWRELRALRDELKRKGIGLAVVYQPTRGLANCEKLSPAEKVGFDYELAKENCPATIAHFRQAGIWIPGFLPLFDEKKEYAYYSKGDHHWTPHGTQRSVKIVAETLKQVPGFEEIPKKQFGSKCVSLLSKPGIFYKAATQLCGNSYATQYVDRSETEPVGANDSGDLFGDGGNLQTALVGTPNSGSAYNFADFLEEFSGADILNNAVSGGGLDSSLLAYMTSEEFHKSPPKILIWEFVTHYDMAQKSSYRRVMPLVDNGCSDQKTMFSRKAKSRQGRNETLLSNAALPIRNGNYVVDVTYSDPPVHELKNIIWYTNGRREQLKIEQSKATDTDGRYVSQLRNDSDWVDQQFLSLKIEAPEDIPQGLEVQASIYQAAPAKASQSVAGR